MKAKTRPTAKLRRSASSEERSARWLAQREHLLQAAQRAIHRVGPQISMDELAAEAGITKPILYRHFGDRKGMARALRDSAFGIMLGVGKADPARTRQAARERVVALYPVVDDANELRRVVVGFATGFLMFVGLNLNLYRFLRSEGVMDQMWEESEDAGREPVAESIEQSLRAIFRDRSIDDVTAQVWANALRAMVVGVVDWWAKSHACDRFELERHFELLTSAIVAGLGDAAPKRATTAKRSAASQPARRRQPPNAPRAAPRKKRR